MCSWRAMAARRAAHQLNVLVVVAKDVGPVTALGATGGGGSAGRGARLLRRPCGASRAGGIMGGLAAAVSLFLIALATAHRENLGRQEVGERTNTRQRRAHERLRTSSSDSPSVMKLLSSSSSKAAPRCLATKNVRQLGTQQREASGSLCTFAGARLAAGVGVLAKKPAGDILGRAGPGGLGRCHRHPANKGAARAGVSAAAVRAATVSAM